MNWTRESERWLRDIFDYIAADNPAAAIRTVDVLGMFHAALDIERYLT